MAVVPKRYIVAVLAAVAAIFLAAIANSGAANPTVQEYYTNLESRLGYSLLLGNARHSGWWEPGTLWPFPIGKAQRLMEEKLYKSMYLANNSRVLDAGAGSGIVASYMAEQGLLVHAIDITPLHVQQAKQTVKARGVDDRVTVELGDYHDLSNLEDESFDAIYTMETFVHADDPRKVLANFMRLLKPGGVLLMHEPEFKYDSEVLRKVLQLRHCQNTLDKGPYEKILAQIGFRYLHLEDMTANVLPLWRLLGVINYVPYTLLKAVGLETRFTNVMAAVEMYSHRDQARYISIRGVKPKAAF